MVDIWSAQMADHCFVLLWYFPIEAYYEVCPDAFPLFLTGSHINLLRGFKTSHCGAGTASSSCPPWPVISACRSAECRTQLLLLMTSACPGFAKALLEKKYRFLNALLPISVAVALSFSHFVVKFAREIRRALTDCIRRLSHSNVNCFYVTSAVRHAVIFRPEHRAWARGCAYLYHNTHQPSHRCRPSDIVVVVWRESAHEGIGVVGLFCVSGIADQPLNHRLKSFWLISDLRPRILFETVKLGEMGDLHAPDVVAG